MTWMITVSCAHISNAITLLNDDVPQTLYTVTRPEGHLFVLANSCDSCWYYFRLVKHATLWGFSGTVVSNLIYNSSA